MSEKHAPLIRLLAARREVELAEGGCLHWDYENPDGSEHDCCHDLAYARNELRIAQRELKNTE